MTTSDDLAKQIEDLVRPVCPPDQPAGVAGRAGPSSRDRNVSTAPTSAATIIQCEYRKSFDGAATNSPSS
jgi:hypothetical protein